MVKKVKQFIYNKNDDLGEDWTDNILSTEYIPVTQLGIQSAPGVQFQINNGGNIEIGSSGIYELDLEGGLGQIRALKITNIDSLKNNSDYNNIIVDIVYESQEA